MANGLNEVYLMGNLGDDPELRFTQGGTGVLNLRLATNERIKRDGEWEDHTEWHNVVVWGKRGESLGMILVKGSRVLIKGNLRTSSYEGKDGVKRYKTEIHAREVVLTGDGGGRSDRGRDDDRRDRRRDRDSDRGRRRDDRGRDRDRDRGRGRDRDEDFR